MKNILIKIEYDGRNFVGWQSQRSKSSASIQETIEQALKKILREKVVLTGSGRTDSGVHASGQVANFNTNSLLSPEKIKMGLNGLLPPEISITSIKEVSKSFHAQFSAKSKLYRYTVFNRKERSVFEKNYSYHIYTPLKVDLMREETEVLLGKHDFRSFQASDKLKKSSVRRVRKIKITQKNDFIFIDIEAEGFLYNMVRNIAGTLIDIGRGKLPAGSMKKILLAKDRRKAGPTAPAKGLCLIKVNY